MRGGDLLRGGCPIGSRDTQRIETRGRRREKVAIDSKHAHLARGQRRFDGVEDERHALALGAKHLRQLRGHRHRVSIELRRTELGAQVAQDRRERERFALQFVGSRSHCRDVATNHTRRFCVDAADVPADCAHRNSKITTQNSKRRANRVPS
jgi:hypothetical protein